MDTFDENSKNLFEGLDYGDVGDEKLEDVKNNEKIGELPTKDYACAKGEEPAQNNTIEQGKMLAHGNISMESEAESKKNKNEEIFSSPYERNLYNNSSVSLEKNNLDDEKLSSPYERVNLDKTAGSSVQDDELKREQAGSSSSVYNDKENQSASSNAEYGNAPSQAAGSNVVYGNAPSQVAGSHAEYGNVASQPVGSNAAYSSAQNQPYNHNAFAQPQYTNNIPHCCDNSGIKGQSKSAYYVSPSASTAGYGMPYGNYADYTGGNFGKTPVKRPMSKGLKSLIAIIITMSVLFVCGFTIEAVRCYNEYGAFGMRGNSDWMDSILDGTYGSDLPFDFDIDSDSDDDSKKDSDKYGDDKHSDKDTDSKKAGIIEAPNEDNVIKSDAELITAVDQPSDIDSTEYNARKAYKKISESVVSIVTYEKNTGLDGDPYGEGTGIIVTEDGYVVTNSHVISDTKSVAVEVITYSGQSYVAAIVGFDARTDLAVLKINASGLKACEFVNSDQIEVGQDALAVGNPGGIEYSNSLTRGAVSAVNRTVSSNAMVTYIQTDAAINPGNSGGPLMNIAGQVMGINTIKIIDTEYEGMGFAIPANTVLEITNDLIKNGYVTGRVRIGISGQAISPYIAAYKNVPQGIKINSFTADSPFNGTDAKVDDIITAVNGEEVTDFTDLYAILDKYKPGDKITVSLYRAGSQSKGKELSVEITLVSDEGQTQNAD